MHFYKGISVTFRYCSNKRAPPPPPPPLGRRLWCLRFCPSISWPADIWQCLCSAISWPADTFDNVCVHPSHDLHFWQCIHPSHDMQTHLTVFVFTCWHIWLYAYDSVCVHPFHDNTVNYYCWLCICPAITWPADTFDSVFIHLMTCTLLTVFVFISCPADIFDNVCVHLSYDLQTLLTMFVSIHLMTCRHFWQCFCVHPSHDVQTVLTGGLTVTW